MLSLQLPSLAGTIICIRWFANHEEQMQSQFLQLFSRQKRASADTSRAVSFIQKSDEFSMALRSSFGYFYGTAQA